MIKVCKFGGSSLADAGQFRKVASIVREDVSRKIIVVSACGRSEVELEKITDLLYTICRCIDENREYDEVFERVRRRYITIRDELGIEYDIESELEDLYARLSNGINEAYVVSRGEYLCALLMAKYLEYRFIDASKVLYFNADGTLNKEKSRGMLREIVENSDGVVIPGFYGALENGEIYTLGRGGSDVSGAIIADLMDVDMYENWSDVSGIFVVDPRIIPDSIKCDHISYQKVRILTYLGANILHEETIFPLISRNISLVIRNTNAPQDKGTLVTQQEIQTDDICGIVGKKGYSLLRFTKDHLTDDNDWMVKTARIFTKYNIPIEHISNGIDSFIILFRSQEIILPKLITSICKHIPTDHYEYTNSLALLGIVGTTDTTNRLERALHCLHDSNISVYICEQDVLTSTCIIVVDEEQLEQAIRVLYNEFV